MSPATPRAPRPVRLQCGHLRPFRFNRPLPLTARDRVRCRKAEAELLPLLQRLHRETALGEGHERVREALLGACTFYRVALQELLAERPLRYAEIFQPIAVAAAYLHHDWLLACLRRANIVCDACRWRGLTLEAAARLPRPRPRARRVCARPNPLPLTCAPEHLAADLSAYPECLMQCLPAHRDTILSDLLRRGFSSTRYLLPYLQTLACEAGSPLISGRALWQRLLRLASANECTLWAPHLARLGCPQDLCRDFLAKPLTPLGRLAEPENPAARDRLSTRLRSLLSCSPAALKARFDRPDYHALETPSDDLPFCCALAQVADWPLFRQCILRGMDPCQTGSIEGESVMEFANGRLMPHLIHELGMDPCHATFAEETALELALWRNDLPAVRTLIEAGCPCDGPDPYRNTPLRSALHYGHEAIIRYLLSLGATNRDGEGHAFPIPAYYLSEPRA